MISNLLNAKWYKSIDAAHRYMRHYLSIMKASDLEIIEPTLPIWIYGLRNHGHSLP